MYVVVRFSDIYLHLVPGTYVLGMYFLVTEGKNYQLPDLTYMYLNNL